MTDRISRKDVQNTALLEALKRAQNYILNHCHPLMPADRRSTHVPATISAAIAQAEGKKGERE